MNILQTKTHPIIVALCLSLAAFCFLPHSALASTSVSGSLTEDTTWAASQSPYVIQGQVTVPAGLTLTIEPGVVVKVVQSGSSRALEIHGALSVEGTAARPIYYTHYYCLDNQDHLTSIPLSSCKN